MKITVEATATIDTLQGKIPARIWQGQTDTGVPVKVWIAVIEPQTHDPVLTAQFEQELKKVPVKRELVSFDLRMT